MSEGSFDYVTGLVDSLANKADKQALLGGGFEGGAGAASFEGGGAVGESSIADSGASVGVKATSVYGGLL